MGSRSFCGPRVKFWLHLTPDSCHAQHLGSGAFADVYLCICDGKQYAVKCFDKQALLKRRNFKRGEGGRMIMSTAMDQVLTGPLAPPREASQPSQSHPSIRRPAGSGGDCDHEEIRA